MERSRDLSNRLREVLLSGQWIANTNFKAQIESLSWEEATLTIGSLNSIAALTFHINYYLAGILDVFHGAELTIRDKYSFDLPAIQSEEEWQTLISSFLLNADDFAKEVERISDSKLDEPFVDEKYGTYHRNIEGVIEHTYYHLGQVSLLRKMIAENEG